MSRPLSALERADFSPSRYVLKNATVPACLTSGAIEPRGDGLGRAHLLVEHGDVIAVVSREDMLGGGAGPEIDLDGGLVLPGFVDMHTHLDKGHIWPRRPNPDGSFAGALEAVSADRPANWNTTDLRRRMEFSLRTAYAQGTVMIRTHLDSIPPQEGISWPLFEELRVEWADRIELQASALFGIESLLVPEFLPHMADVVARARGTLGAVTYMVEGLAGHLDAMFEAAKARGLDLDFHVDETGDPSARSLAMIAETAIRRKFRGRIVVGHCCSLACQEPDEADRTLDLVARAGIGVVSLPMCNMYLQDRQAGRTPRWRGVTLLHEMKARGIPVAVASDNTRDPFYAYGDMDMVEVFTQAMRIAHLDHPVGDWIRAVTSTPADLLGEGTRGRIEPGLPADLVVFSARDWNELGARPKGPRRVLRSGREISSDLPDHRELDDLMEPRTHA
ncbi:MAG: cytosine deaminase [Stappia sp.]|uniref:cytosine deaminase n=1 Tax=Stappia sp. TaxID=1870903 RepID=UPI000C543F83|nr:cytosine deaminase [Stappia sp.]MBM21543.1 cytosine deaminase [Stappia sp.]